MEGLYWRLGSSQFSWRFSDVVYIEIVFLVLLLFSVLYIKGFDLKAYFYCVTLQVN